jgi:hypothetical protein
MTPEQKAQLSATGNTIAQRTADIALDEAAWRLKNTRNKTTADPKD